MARRLKTIARWINENLPGLTAVLGPGYCNTDRKIKGTRLRVVGKGRKGNQLEVHDQAGKLASWCTSTTRQRRTRAMRTSNAGSPDTAKSSGPIQADFG